MSPHLKNILNQPIVIDNKGGVGSTIGTESVAKSEPDGYTLLLNTDVIAIMPSLFKKLNFDPQKDFAPISFITSAPIVLAANPEFPVNSVKELIALAKKNPGQVSLATPGAGSPQDLASILFAHKAQIKFNSIPYKGNGPALVDILAGHVNIGMFTLSTVKEYAKTGKLKILAVISSKRTPLAPEIVSLTEAGLPDVEVSSRYLILAPAKTPKDIVLKLEKDFAKLVENKNYQSELLNLGFEAISTSSAETTEILNKENSKWTPILKNLDISIQ
ncbi:MAG: tripartite tricarboxylate transporter substrate binding protein, partial [Betaproteobacteria bacterium]|nr:tripartite tricarboxylate transporter substrate binding protein [Betaproteobacteria bacterium]